MTTTMPTAASLSSDLLGFIDHEQETQRLEEAHRMALSPADRVDGGVAIGGLVFERVDPGNARRWHFRCTTNLSRLRPGDDVVLTDVDDRREQGGVFKVVDDLDPDRLVLAPSPKEGPSSPAALDGRVWVADPKPFDAWFLVRQALRFLDRRPDVVDDFVDRAPLGVDLARAAAIRAEAPKHVFLAGLDPTQLEAVVTAMSATRGALVQGPPGTGKTRTLAALALTLAQLGLRVAVACFTHNAADTVVRALRTVDAKGVVRVARVGAKGALPPNVQGVERHQELGIRSGVAVSTAHKLAGARVPDFDVVLLDEATQLVLPLAVAAMSHGTRWVLFGDHRQMAPVIVGPRQPEWLRRSAFEHLLPRTPWVMLETCRRMSSELIRFSSEAWYAGRVTSAADVAARRFRLPNAARAGDWVDQVLAPEAPGVVVEVAHGGFAQHNPIEAKAVAQLVARAVERGLPPREVAVVTPYRRQEREIRSQLAARLGMDTAAAIRVDTVERIQGDEREMIVLSLCDSAPGGSLTELHLNVAITRAKSKRVVVGSPVALSARTHGAAWARLATLAEQDTRVTASV